MQRVQRRHVYAKSPRMPGRVKNCGRLRPRYSLINLTLPGSQFQQVSRHRLTGVVQIPHGMQIILSFGQFYGLLVSYTRCTHTFPRDSPTPGLKN